MKNLELAKLLICFSIATYATVDFAADSLVDDESIETSSVVKKNRKSRSNRNKKSGSKQVDFVADDESTVTNNAVRNNRKSRSNRNKKQVMQSELQQSEITDTDKNTTSSKNKKNKKNKNGKVQKDEAISQRTEQAIQTLQRAIEDLDEEKRQTVIEKIEKASKFDITADKMAYVDALTAIHEDIGGNTLDVFIANITKDNEIAKKDLSNLLVSLKSKNKKVWNIVKKHTNKSKSRADKQETDN